MPAKLTSKSSLPNSWQSIAASALLALTTPAHADIFGDFGKAVEKGVQDVGKTAEKAGQDVGKTAEKTGQDVGKTAEKAGQDIGKTAEKAGQDIGKTAEKAGQDISKTAEKTAQDIGKGGEKVGQDIGKAAEKAVQDIGKTAEKAAQDIGKTAEKAGQDIGKTAEKAGQDIGKTAEKAVQDTGAEGGRFARNLGDAAQAVGHFLEGQGQGAGKALSNAERRVREGKVVDALWHLGTEPLQSTEENAAKAVQESAYLNTVAQVAANAYGGPAGAAAYAAWYTYKQTGDVELAFKVGLLTGATSKAFAEVGEMPSKSAQQLAKKALVAGTVGGIAVAAAGGNEAAIKEGFLLSGGMILIQDGYKRVTGGKLDARASEGEAYCMSTVGSDCSPPESAYLRDKEGNILYGPDGDPQIDMTKVDPRRPHVGKWSGDGNPNWSQERSTFMTSVSRVPGMNAMSVFHDQWAISWDMNSIASPATIIPAVVLTYVGTGAPYYQLIQSSATKPRSPANIQGYGEVIAPPTTISPKVIERFETQSAVSTFACVLKEESEILIIDRPDGTKLDCRVVLIADSDVPTVLATAKSHAQCLSFAGKTVAEKASKGYSCFTRDTVPLPGPIGASRSESIPRVFPSVTLQTVGMITILTFAILFSVVGFFGGTMTMQRRFQRAQRRPKET